MACTLGTTNPGAKLHVTVSSEASALANEDATHPLEIWGVDQMLAMGVNTAQRVAYLQSVDVGSAVSTLVLNPSGGAVGRRCAALPDSGAALPDARAALARL